MARLGKKGKSAQKGATPFVKRNHDWVKDDEELDLEAKLFGTSKKRSKKNGLANGTVETVEVDTGLAELDDDDLFTVDAPVAPQSDEEAEVPGMDEIDYEATDDEDDVDVKGIDGEGLDGEDDEEEDDDDDDDNSDAESSSSRSSSSAGSSASSVHFDDNAENDELYGASSSTNRKTAEYSVLFPEDVEDLREDRKGKGKSVWHDPSDETIMVNLEANNRTKKLGRGKQSGPEVPGKEFEARLREQFERLHPRPDWTSKRAIAGTPSISSLLTSTKSFIEKKGKRSALEQGRISIQRMLDANHQNPTSNVRDTAALNKGVVDVAWHPSEKVGVMAVAGADRRLRFFNIDGHTNPTLLTIHIPALPLTNTTFHPSGSTLLLTGIRPYYYTYDLPSSRCLRSPRNLFGSGDSASAPNSLGRHAFSPDGTMLAVAGRRGAVAILDWSGTGVGAVIAELKTGRGGSVASMVWSLDNKELSVLGGRDGAEVEIWDVGARRVVRKWRDDRAFGGSTMTMSGDGRYTAVGASTGIVNLYSTSSFSASPTSGIDLPELSPEPIRSLEHLTLPITTTEFHPSNEILMTASNQRKGQFKLYHLPSGTAFTNWPTQTTPLGRVNAARFSPNGEYLAAGNQRGHVVTYRLKHFSNAA